MADDVAEAVRNQAALNDGLWAWLQDQGGADGDSLEVSLSWLCPSEASVSALLAELRAVAMWAEAAEGATDPDDERAKARRRLGIAVHATAVTSNSLRSLNELTTSMIGLGERHGAVLNSCGFNLPGQR